MPQFLLPALVVLPTGVSVAGIAPALLLLWLVVVTDRRPEPPGLVLVALLLGVGSALLARHIEDPVAQLVRLAPLPWESVTLRGIFVAAIPEELLKVGAIALLVMRLRDVHEPMHGLVLGAAAGLGFASLENLGYLAHNPADWMTVAFIRAATSVPFHCSLGMLAGAYLASARFSHALGFHAHDHGARLRLIFLAWVLPTALHALYDIPLLAQRDGLASTPGTSAALSLSGLAVGLATFYLAVRLALRLTRHQHIAANHRSSAVRAWRSVWSLIVAGGAVAFLGVALLLPELYLSAFGVPVDMHSATLGAVLLLLAVAIFQWGRQRLNRQQTMSQV